MLHLVTDPTHRPADRPASPPRPRLPPGLRRLTGLLLALAGVGMVLSGLSTILHH